MPVTKIKSVCKTPYGTFSITTLGPVNFWVIQVDPKGKGRVVAGGPTEEIATQKLEEKRLYSPTEVFGMFPATEIKEVVWGQSNKRGQSMKRNYKAEIVKRAAEDDGHKSCKRCDKDFDAAGGEGYKDKWCSKECYEGPKYENGKKPNLPSRGY